MICITLQATLMGKKTPENTAFRFPCPAKSLSSYNDHGSPSQDIEDPKSLVPLSHGSQIDPTSWLSTPRHQDPIAFENSYSYIVTTFHASRTICLHAAQFVQEDCCEFQKQGQADDGVKMS